MVAVIGHDDKDQDQDHEEEDEGEDELVSYYYDTVMDGRRLGVNVVHTAMEDQSTTLDSTDNNDDNGYYYYYSIPTSTTTIATSATTNNGSATGNRSSRNSSNSTPPSTTTLQPPPQLPLQPPPKQQPPQMLPPLYVYLFDSVVHKPQASSTSNGNNPFDLMDHEFKHFTLDGIERSKYIRRVLNRTEFARMWYNDNANYVNDRRNARSQQQQQQPQSTRLVWVADIGEGYDRRWCSDLHNEISSVQKEIQQLEEEEEEEGRQGGPRGTRRRQGNTATSKLPTWPIYMMDWEDSTRMPSQKKFFCVPLYKQFGRQNFFYRKRSIVKGRHWDPNAKTIRPGRINTNLVGDGGDFGGGNTTTPATGSKNANNNASARTKKYKYWSDEPVHHASFGVRTDHLQTLHDVIVEDFTTKYYNNDNEHSHTTHNQNHAAAVRRIHSTVDDDDGDGDDNNTGGGDHNNNQRNKHIHADDYFTPPRLQFRPTTVHNNNNNNSNNNTISSTILDYSYHNSNNNKKTTTLTAATTNADEDADLSRTVPLSVSLDLTTLTDRPIDVSHFWPCPNATTFIGKTLTLSSYNTTPAVDRGGRNHHNSRLRDAVSCAILEWAQDRNRNNSVNDNNNGINIDNDSNNNDNNVNVLVGLAGKANTAGRNDAQKPYARALLQTKIVVVAQKDDWEDHYRLMEALTSGALVFSDRMLAPPVGTEHGVNIVFYDSVPDLLVKLDYYLFDSGDGIGGGRVLGDRGRPGFNIQQRREEMARHGRYVALTRHQSRHIMERALMPEREDVEQSSRINDERTIRNWWNPPT
eukprot:CAMPEP_0113471536 /NCGR_PEP_ID=MMETSP0014_2-20120614/17026_1 /TAXON_ID=2857 /ORGANISM="Nitzschia sp." /LENGTH=804 /DNA_ID=CAMNT_0000364169 /DNA_START=225 /DNA_END=2641 /DNA_ORIENTATION=- /assembly_acc=CAM_ASM_000159